MTDKIIVHSTCGSAGEADRIARHLVDLRLAACVAITPAVRSHYRWQGVIEQSEECALAIKTRRDLFSALCRELSAIHSYQVPEILAVPILDGTPAYLQWLDGELAPPPAPESLP